MGQPNPNKDGPGIRAEEQTSLLPVVILTGSKEEQDLIKGYSLGANSYINKPVDFTQLVEVVRQVTSYWLALNVVPSEGSNGVE